MRTLIVDDDFTSRLLLQSLLTHYGECHIAVNGREAVSAFRSARAGGEPYDLICMDIMMPDMDGQTAVKEIRALEGAAGTPPAAAVKIIMTTALDDMKNVVESLRASCNAYLLKPVAAENLLGRLKSFGLIA